MRRPPVGTAAETSSATAKQLVRRLAADDSADPPLRLADGRAELRSAPGWPVGIDELWRLAERSGWTRGWPAGYAAGFTAGVDVGAARILIRRPRAGSVAAVQSVAAPAGRRAGVHPAVRPLLGLRPARLA